MSSTIATLLTLVSIAVGASATWNPHILVPNAQTLWVIGQHYNVTWNTSDAPSGAALTGQVFLSNAGVIDPVPLASGFSLLDGSALIAIPNGLHPANTYAIVLEGDPTNISPEFILAMHP